MTTEFRIPGTGAEEPFPEVKPKNEEVIMAELKRQTLGDATGKVGHVTFMIKGNKNIICKEAVRTAIPTEAALARRAKFKLTGLVCKAIYNSGELKNLWPKPGTNKGSRFSEMFKKNYPLIGTPDQLGNAIVIPDHGVQVKNALITLTQSGMTIAADQLDPSAGIDPSVEKYVAAEGIVIMETPVAEGDLPYRILSVRTGFESLDTDQPISMNFEFGGSTLSEFKSYTDKKVYLTFLTLKTSGEAVHYTEQFNN